MSLSVFSPSVDDNFTCFYFLAINIDAINVRVCIFAWRNVFNYFEYTPSSKIVRLYDDFMFNFLYDLLLNGVICILSLFD